MTIQPSDGRLPQTWRELAVWLRHARPAVRFRAVVFLLALAAGGLSVAYDLVLWVLHF